LEKLAAMIEQFNLYGGMAELNEWAAAAGVARNDD
jgi:hypothetical protein